MVASKKRAALYLRSLYRKALEREVFNGKRKGPVARILADRTVFWHDKARA